MPRMRLFVFLLCLAWGLPSGAQGQASKNQEQVVVFSFDGLAADYFGPRTMPRLWALSEAGRRGRAVPPFPATTFNGHTTLATGCWPGHHGIVANGFLDPQLGLQPYAATAELLEREPLWVAAARSGVSAAVYSWPCATGPWQGVLPQRLAPFQGQAPDRRMLAFAEESLDQGTRLVMAYSGGADEEGHIEGPQSRAVRERLAALDAELAPWLSRQLAVRPGLRVILTGDHGMTTMHKLIRLPEVLKGLEVRAVAHGGSAYVYAEAPETRAEAARRLRARGLEVWTREALPAAFRLGSNPRVGDLVVVAPLGTWLAQRSGEAFLDEAKGRRGAHAYPSHHRAMHAWLVVLGVSPGPLGEVPLWDLAPTVAAWLKIRWAKDPDGRPVPALLTR